jgi:hypothetical protein
MLARFVLSLQWESRAARYVSRSITCFCIMGMKSRALLGLLLLISLRKFLSKKALAMRLRV